METLGHIPVREELIWSMRSSEKEALSEFKLHSKIATQSTETSPMSEQVSATSLFQMSDPVKDKASIMSSFVPDEVLRTGFDEQDVQEIRCCLLYGRVTGLNKLVTKYTNRGIDCIKEISDILNNLIGQTVQEMLSSGSDVLKFGMDSVTTMWKTDGDDLMGTYVHLALDCAIVISKYCKSYIEEKNYPLGVTLGITAGDLLLTYVGDENHTNMLIFGETIEQMKSVRKENMTDDIIISAVALGFVYANEYIHELLEDERYYKISGLSPAWRGITKAYNNVVDDRSNDIVSSTSIRTVLAAEQRRSIFFLRPIIMNCIFDAFKMKGMRKFLTETIARSIEFEEPLQNLTEIRQIIVAFACITTNMVNIWNLLAITEEAVKIFQRNATKYFGSLYFVEMVDMQIHLSIVFGLRGFKHTLECRKCLLCCLKSRDEIRSRFASLDTISIGISRGRSFCSAVGHSLRREYLFMGSTSVRAELMAAAYVDKVTCDSNVFLHSKLKHTSFKLQEKSEAYDKYFAGPIYEFLKHDELSSNLFTSYPNPTLGNNVQIALFKEYLQKWLHGSDEILENIFLIKGFAKEGKTRLLRDMVANVEQGVPVNYFKMRIGDDERPYRMLTNLFAAPLGWTSSMNTNMRKKMIRNYLPKIKDAKKLNALFEVFQLAESNPNTKKPKNNVIMDCLTVLCKECFKTPWLIAIDDIDFMDSHSWDALQPLIETNLFFLLMTCKRSYQIKITSTYQKHMAKTIRLNGLGKEYIGAFACQVMNVYAIPADLEFALHKKGNGNPGWITNLLVSLLELGKLIIKDASYITLLSLGLVCPPIWSIFKISKEEENAIDELINAHPNLQQQLKSQTDMWNSIYNTWEVSEEEDFIIRQAIIDVHLKRENCRVCFLSEDFSIGNFDGEETREIYIAQILDSLTYHEQIFLKCCSILGVTFLREVLYFVNPRNVHYEFAQIVQKMFEKNILVCAGGDFTERPSIIRKSMEDPSNVEAMICDCRNLIIEDRNRLLPKYASCGYLRFKTSSLRNVVYNSLGREQRIEFHSKAITYLRERLKKCSPCGCGKFKIGPPSQAALMKKRKKKKRKSGKLEFMPMDYASDGQYSISEITRNVSMLSSVMFHNKPSKTTSVFSSGSDSFDLDDFEGSFYDQESSFVFSTAVLHYNRREALTRTFSYNDFTYCECDEILSDYYYQMIIHYRGSEQPEHMLQNMIDYGNMCISFKNLSEATKISQEAQRTIEKIFEKGAKEQWRKPLLEAKVYNIQAQILVHTKEHDQALELLLSAMKKYKRPLPSTNISKFVKLKWQKWRVLITGIFRENTMESDISLEQYLYFCDLSETLGLLCDIYMMKEDFLLAELTAMWSLNKALRAKANYKKIFEAYERALHVYEYLPAPKIKMLLETMALLQCQKMKDSVEFDEFRVITKLYSTLTRIRYPEEDLNASVKPWEKVNKFPLK